MVLMALRACVHTHFVCDVSTSREAICAGGLLTDRL